MNRKDALKQEVRKLLDDLGRDSNAVHVELRDAGYKGLLVDAEMCPVAVYLREDAGMDVASVQQSYIMVRRGCTSVEVEPPPPVRDFVDRFDAGHFPELEKGR